MVVFILALGVGSPVRVISNAHPALQLPNARAVPANEDRVVRPRQLVAFVLKTSNEDKNSVSLERIEITPFAVIAGEILQNRKTGHLTILKPPLRKVLYWSQGELVMAASMAAEDSLGDFLVRRGAIAADRAAHLFAEDANDVVARVHDAGVLDLSARQALLREWLAAQFTPLFSLDEGTAAFTED